MTLRTTNRPTKPAGRAASFSRRHRALAALLAFALAPLVAASSPLDLVLRDAPPARAAAAGAASAGGELVRVDSALLAAAPERLWIEPVAGEGRWAYRSGHESGADGSVVWRGRFAEDAPGHASITLSLRGGVVLGRIELPGGPTWLLRPGEAGGSRLFVEPGVGAACGVGERPPEAPAVAPGPAAAADHAVGAAEERLVYVLVLYTPRAAAKLGAQSIEQLAPHHVDVLNTTLANSGVDGRAALAGVARAELGMLGLADQQAVDHAFRQPAARALQDEYRADVVSVVADSDEEFVSSFCGWSNLMFAHLYGPQMANQAYNVIAHRCYHVSWLFAHEVAHNFGAHHDPANAGPPELNVFPFAFAHGVDGGVRTVMSYSSACEDCEFLSGNFSNPLISVGGVPTGLHDERDNARTLNLTFPLVATFRAGRPPVAATAPAAPSDLTATPLSPSEVALAWVDNAGDGTGFQVERSAQPAPGGGWQRVATLPADATGHTVGGLAADTEYRFRVRAVRGEAVSAFSTEATARTPGAVPAAPTAVTALPFPSGDVGVVFAEAPRATGYEVEVRGADPAGDRVEDSPPIALSGGGAQAEAQVLATIQGLDPDAPHTFRVRATNEAGAGPWSDEASATTFPAGGIGPCVEDGSTLCLLDGRFAVTTHWRNPRPPFDFGTGAAKEAAGSARTGFFTFFNPSNVELAVKMIDGRPVNGDFWHFYGALSDVEYWVTVRDTGRDGPDDASRTYHNPPFEICGRGDTGAFPGGPEQAAPEGLLQAAKAAAEACEAGSETLCLQGGRFEVEVDWQNPRIEGDAGVGRVFAGQEGDLTGHFWFFRPDNLELSVKILDGRALNGHFWIFWGGLSDVGYTIRVTDTESGTEHQFVNPPLTLCGGAETGVL